MKHLGRVRSACFYNKVLTARRERLALHGFFLLPKVTPVPDFRPIYSAMLVCLLTLTIGFGSVAHALSKDCVGGHCDNRMSSSAQVHPGSDTALKSAFGGTHEPESTEHDGCNPYLCLVLALASPHSEETFDYSETVLGWQVRHLMTLEEPDNPDRPPNL